MRSIKSPLSLRACADSLLKRFVNGKVEEPINSAKLIMATVLDKETVTCACS